MRKQYGNGKSSVSKLYGRSGSHGSKNASRKNFYSSKMKNSLYGSRKGRFEEDSQGGIKGKD